MHDFLVSSLKNMPSTKQVHSAASTRSSPKQDIRQNVRGAISRPKALNNLDAKGEWTIYTQRNNIRIKNKYTLYQVFFFFKDNQDVKTNDSSHLTEVDREWFNIKIRDLEDKLARFLE